MNERIKELANEARTYALTLEDREEDYVDVFEQKFAELIVRECGQVIESYDPDFDWATVELKKHFGVEE